MRCLVIGDEFTILGFELLGIPGIIVATPEQALSELKKAVRQEDIGLILITEKTADTVRQQVEEIKLARRLPVILEIPDRGGSLPSRETIVDLVRRTVGIKL